MRKCSLNWNAVGNCCFSCQVQSRNCENTGETSRGSVVDRSPSRSVNLWPKDSHSRSSRIWVGGVTVHWEWDRATTSKIVAVSCGTTVVPIRLSHSTDHEAMQCPVVRVHHHLCQRACLGGAVPPVRAVHHHTTALLVQRLEEKGRGSRHTYC